MRAKDVIAQLNNNSKKQGVEREYNRVVEVIAKDARSIVERRKGEKPNVKKPITVVKKATQFSAKELIENMKKQAHRMGEKSNNKSERDFNVKDFSRF